MAAQPQPNLPPELARLDAAVDEFAAALQDASDKGHSQAELVDYLIRVIPGAEMMAPMLRAMVA